VPVPDAGRFEGPRERIDAELRMKARTGDRANIDDAPDPVRPEQLQELLRLRVEWPIV